MKVEERENGGCQITEFSPQRQIYTIKAKFERKGVVAMMMEDGSLAVALGKDETERIVNSYHPRRRYKAPTAKLPYTLEALRDELTKAYRTIEVLGKRLEEEKERADQFESMLKVPKMPKKSTYVERIIASIAVNGD